MTTTTIRALPAATLSALSDLIPVDQADGTTRAETLQQIATLLAPVIGAAAHNIVQVAVNSGNQIVVTYNDGSTAVAGTFASNNTSAAFSGDLSGGSLIRTGSAKPIPFQDLIGAAVYDFASFDPQGRGSNIFGFAPAVSQNAVNAGTTSMGDDATAAAVFKQILADLVKCKEPFYNATIVMRPGHYYKWGNWNWMVPLQAAYNSIYPPGGTMVCARLNLRLEAKNVIIHDFSTDTTGGILMGGYDVLSHISVFGKIVYRVQAAIQYAFRRDAAIGTDYNGFAAAGNGGTNNATGATIPAAQSTANGTTTQFELYDVEIQDASPTLTAQCGVMVGGAVFSFIDKYAHYGIPQLRADGSSVTQLNSASICYFGFTVYASVANNLCQYKQSVVDFRGYMESFQGTNFGGSNNDYTLYTNRPLYDWRGGYSNTDPRFSSNVTGLAFVLDPLSQIDNFKGCINVIGVVRLTVKGGYYSLHNIGGNTPVSGTDSVYTGDNGTNAAFNMLGCSEVYFSDTQIVGPGATPKKTPAIRWGTWTPTQSETSSPNGPQPYTSGSQHLTVRDCDFQGWGEDPNTPPIEVDPGTDLVRVLGSQWGSHNHDGLTIGMRLATAGTGNVSYGGNLTAFSTTTGSGSSFVQGNSSSGLPAGLGVCEDSASSYHCYAVGTALPSVAGTQGALINVTPMADPTGMCTGANAATNPGAIVIQRAGTYQITVYGASTNATVGDGINITYFSKTTGNGPAVYVTANGTSFATTQTFTKTCVVGEVLYGELGAGAHAIALSAFDMTVRMIDLPQ